LLRKSSNVNRENPAINGLEIIDEEAGTNKRN
jgi:hypothetical protein